ncbi:MAG: hypothetical protein GY679_04475 [Mycoplasma sp.]|nr:hypothetical protein [Mycoplasma sp.]
MEILKKLMENEVFKALIILIFTYLFNKVRYGSVKKPSKNIYYAFISFFITIVIILLSFYLHMVSGFLRKKSFFVPEEFMIGFALLPWILKQILKKVQKKIKQN